MGYRLDRDKRRNNNFKLDPFYFKGLEGSDRLKSLRLTARMPKRIKTSPETTLKLRDSPKIKAEDITPMTGIHNEPMAVFMAGRLLDTVR